MPDPSLCNFFSIEASGRRMIVGGILKVLKRNLKFINLSFELILFVSFL